MNSLSAESDDRRKLDALQAELADRQSIVHFAHAAVSTVVALILAGAAAKLLWDLPLQRRPYAYPVVAAAAFLVVYALVQYFQGRSDLASEMTRFQSMKDLRAELRLDDPSALLPK